MSHHRFARTATLAVVLCAVAAPGPAAQPGHAADTARHAEATQDLRSPGAPDAADGRGTPIAPEVTVVRVTEPSPSPSNGLDWGDAGIGAGSALGLVLLGLGGTLMVVHRKRGDRRQPATTG